MQQLVQITTVSDVNNLISNETARKHGINLDRICIKNRRIRKWGDKFNTDKGKVTIKDGGLVHKRW